MKKKIFIKIIFPICVVAYLAFVTGRFIPKEVIGRTMIIHNMPDDFISQPAGNAGSKIACGEIQSSRVR